MTRVLSVFGTRPEAIKMAPLLRELARRTGTFTSHVCVTGQHREMLGQALQLFAIRPDYDLNVMAEDQTPAGVAASVLKGLGPILRQERPDWVLVQGDTTTVARSCTGVHGVTYHPVPSGDEGAVSTRAPVRAGERAGRHGARRRRPAHPHPLRDGPVGVRSRSFSNARIYSIGWRRCRCFNPLTFALSVPAFMWYTLPERCNAPTLNRLTLPCGDGQTRSQKGRCHRDDADERSRA
jgi:hypothetical protein